MGKSNTRSEAYIQLHNYVKNEMMNNPNYVFDAITKRNLIIKSLKSEINHRIITFEETEKRFYELLHSKESLEKENDKLKELVKKISFEKEKLKKYMHEIENLIEKYKFNDEHSWDSKVKKSIKFLPKKLKGILYFLLTPPFSIYLLIFIYILTLFASLLGWEKILLFLKPFLALFN